MWFGRTGRADRPAADAPADAVRAASLAGIERWRSVAASPMSDRQLVEAAEIVSRAYEELYTQPA